MNEKQLKIIGMVVLVIMILNMIIFALGIIGDMIFWGVIIVGAVFAYWVLPKLKK